MEGVDVFAISFKRKDIVISFGSSTHAKTNKNISVDPALLFQRLLLVAKSSEINLILKYEMCTFPPSLFESQQLLRKPVKADLDKAITKCVQERSPPNNLQVTKIDNHQYVLDGG